MLVNCWLLIVIVMVPLFCLPTFSNAYEPIVVTPVPISIVTPDEPR